MVISDWSSVVCSSDLRFGRGRQVELINRLGRRRLGVGVRAEGRAQPLPDTPRLAVGHALRATERQMLDQMREAALGFAFGQRPGVDPHPDRDLPRRHKSEEHTSELQSLMRISYAV